MLKPAAALLVVVDTVATVDELLIELAGAAVVVAVVAIVAAVTPPAVVEGVELGDAVAIVGDAVAIVGDAVAAVDDAVAIVVDAVAVVDAVPVGAPVVAVDVQTTSFGTETGGSAIAQMFFANWIAVLISAWPQLAARQQAMPWRKPPLLQMQWMSMPAQPAMSPLDVKPATHDCWKEAASEMKRLGDAR